MVLAVVVVLVATVDSRHLEAAVRLVHAPIFRVGHICLTLSFFNYLVGYVERSCGPLLGTKIIDRCVLRPTGESSLGFRCRRIAETNSRVVYPFR